jgi:uncharacterized membrane protein YgaE (UPF0421/DUF939 family)
MNQTSIALIVSLLTLLGVIIGGLISYFIAFAQFRYNKKLKEQEIIQQKLEEICQIIEGIGESYHFCPAKPGLRLTV